MLILQSTIILFAFMELSNVLIMYFKPDFQYGNSMKTFYAFEESKSDENSYLFAKYMTNWVANCKLIFICILIVIAFIGDLLLLRFAVVVTISSISIFFISLYPIIKKLDDNDRVCPKGYSKTLSKIIFAFIAMFSVAFILSFYF